MPHDSNPSCDDLLRVLLMAEQCDPETVSVPLEGWSHSRAIHALDGVVAHTATQVRNRDRFERAGVDPATYSAIDSERVARPIWRLEELLRGGTGKGWTTVMALRSISYAYYERVLWRAFRERIRGGAFDVVHRLTPLSPTVASRVARRVERAGVPFVVGPINGGVPWPREFDSARRREKEWLSYVRGAYRLAPGYRAMREAASAIIVGSRDTLRLEPENYHDKCVYIPENAIDPARFEGVNVERDRPSPMRVAFVGRLVPYKAADMLLEAAAPLVRDGAVVIDIIGDGPERGRLETIVEREAIGHGVEMAGWVPHTSLKDRLGRAHVFGFPSVREFGGAVVLEAMALGVVPVVMDYGGPGELVTPRTGFALPMAPRGEIVERLRGVLADLAGRPGDVAAMGERARRRVFARFTWEAKARQVLGVYRWVTGRASKPDYGMPLPDLADVPGEVALARCA
ncbi:MAG: glycosyltransferase [Phycisphaerales bacterium]|nr:glycosyltransferase [Phycisphaerales bacterium]